MSKLIEPELLEEIKEHYQTTQNVTTTARKYFNQVHPDKSPLEFDSFRRTLSNILYRKGATQREDARELEEDYAVAKGRTLSKTQYYIFTWEQNSTSLHKQLWRNILAYKEYLGAELSVILGRYKNPTSVFTDKKYETYNTETRPYHDANRHRIHPHISVVSDVKIQPTRKYPLRGIKDLSRGDTVIVGHPTFHLTSEPRLNGYKGKLLLTTGAVTLPNYTDSAIGGISKENHKLGFLIVEIKDEEIYFVRQVEADKSGNFIDLIHEVKDGKIIRVNKAKALICGDSHQWEIDDKIDGLNDYIAKQLNVDHIVLHDVADGYTVNNHILKNPIALAQRFNNDKYDIETELQDLVKWLDKKAPFNPIVISANHNDRYDRAMLEDWRKDIPNSLFYLKYTQKAIQGELNEKGIVADYIHEHLGDKVITLDYTDSFKIGKYEVSQHGDHGANGARGSTNAFRDLGIPIILGHSHVPYRAGDCFYVGTSTPLTLDYNRRGMSSWMNANVLIAKNGIAQHLIFNGHEFTTFEL